MLISDYLSSNTIICIWPILESYGRNTNIFSFVFGSNENFKICFPRFTDLYKKEKYQTSNEKNQE